MTEKKYIKFCMAQVKSSRVAISAIHRAGIEKGSCLNYDYMIEI